MRPCWPFVSPYPAGPPAPSGFRPVSAEDGADQGDEVGGPGGHRNLESVRSRPGSPPNRPGRRGCPVARPAARRCGAGPRSSPPIGHRPRTRTATSSGRPSARGACRRSRAGRPRRWPPRPGVPRRRASDRPAWGGWGPRWCPTRRPDRRAADAVAARLSKSNDRLHPTMAASAPSPSARCRRRGRSSASSTPPSASTRTDWPGSSSEAAAPAEVARSAGGRGHAEGVEAGQQLGRWWEPSCWWRRPPACPGPAGRRWPRRHRRSARRTATPRRRGRRSTGTPTRTAATDGRPADPDGSFRERCRAVPAPARSPWLPSGCGGWSRPAGRPTRVPGRSARTDGTAARRLPAGIGPGSAGDGRHRIRRLVGLGRRRPTAGRSDRRSARRSPWPPAPSRSGTSRCRRRRRAPGPDPAAGPEGPSGRGPCGGRPGPAARTRWGRSPTR